jgi:hypothetical protein
MTAGFCCEEPRWLFSVSQVFQGKVYTMKNARVLMVLVAMLASSPVFADESGKAATSDLPAALQMAGISQSSVVASGEAHQVRGQALIGGGIDFSQIKEFELTGTGSGTSQMLEGITASFTYSINEEIILDDGTLKTISLEVVGDFAGLAGNIGINNDINAASERGSLHWLIGGKLFSENLNFDFEDFRQTFRQNFSITPLPPPLP